MKTPLTIVAIGTAKSGKQDALRAEQEKLVAATVREPGCLRYELHQSLEDPRVLVFFESWASEADWRAHMNGAAIADFHSSGAGAFFADFSLHRMSLVTDGTFDVPAVRMAPPPSGPSTHT